MPSAKIRFNGSQRSSPAEANPRRESLIHHSAGHDPRKRVVIVGGSSGVGFAVAEAALAEGAEVIIASSNIKNVKTAADRLRNTASGAAMDVKDEESVAKFFGSLATFDHLIFTAGDWSPSIFSNPLAQMDFSETMGEGLKVRFWGSLMTIKHALSRLEANGSITLTDGILSHLARKGAPLTTAFGGATEYLVRGLAVDLVLSDTNNRIYAINKPWVASLR